MFSHASLIFVLGYLSRVSTQSTSTPVPTFCFEGACYKRPDGSDKNWTEAQKMCENFGSTLPIVNDPVHQRSFEAACRNLTSSYARNNTRIWIGARAIINDSINWRWLNGRIYNGTDLQSREYQTSYAYASNTSNGVFAYAATPTNAYSYICYYPTPEAQCRNGIGQTIYYIENRCYVKYDAKMSWFGARNNCLSNHGDLASFTELSLLDGKIDSDRVWIGLRNSQWKWQYPVTEVSTDVTFTLWSPDQPNDTVPSCISIDDGDKFPAWRDWNCSQQLPFICQVNRTTSTTAPTVSPTAAMYSMASALTSRDPNTPTNPRSSTANPTMASSSTRVTEDNTSSRPTHLAESSDASSVNISLAIGVGVGIGVSVIILIVAVIVLIFLRREGRNSFAGGHSQSTNESVPNNTKPETSETNEMENGRTVSHNASAQYTTVIPAMAEDGRLPSNQRIVYEPLSFNPASG